MAGRIATEYRKDRIFLAGDAAHQLPPTRGGFGANTGIDDVWNLAWKLKWVLSGQADVKLLDTYSQERQPIAWLRHQQTFSRPDYQKWVGNNFQAEPLFSNEALEFGQLNRSSAVVADTKNLPAAAEIADWAGQAGTRAPHIFLTYQNNTLSSLDLWGSEFVLLSPADECLVQAQLLGIKTVDIKEVDFPQQHSFATLFGVQENGAVLVRPDGIIAWQCQNSSQIVGLEKVITQILAKY
ncbi:FAD binding domain-containing protein [Basfia succiniciproducens]|uniref:FAD binding domain-containing protein n=1 Tax=Basfia succiniciproducens TaxID=653940 RepID=A0A1G5CB61_9PAST|nr:hypothetical protein A4G13_04610 [Basfia succiniciproducens]SCX99558.1 FAD binding domain-containing protein [Basfia succiniciproducens]